MIEARVDEDIRQAAFDYLAPRAHIQRDLEHTDRHIAFVNTQTAEIEGCLLFSDYDRHNIFVHLALDTPRVCQRRYIKLMFDYMFNQCKCERATAMCIDGYERNERLLSGTGWTKEGVVRRSIKVQGEWKDAALYGMLKGECRWV